MRILHIVHVFPPEHAPAGVNAEEAAEDFTRMGHHVTVITGWPNHPAGVLYPGWCRKWRSVVRAREGYALTRINHSIHPRKKMTWRMWYYFTFAVNSFLSGLLAGRADVVVCESTPIFGPVAALLLARIKRATFVYRIHDVHPESALNAGLLRPGMVYRAMRALDSFVCRHSTRVLTLTEAMRDCLLVRGLQQDQVLISRHWVDGSKIQPTSRENGWRHQHRIPLNKTVVLHAGTIGHISGAQVIIQAAAKLAHRADLLFLFVGDGPLREPCEKLAHELGLRHVRFLPFQPAEVLNEVQATGDMGILTLLARSGESSIPSKMHGYTAAGRPVIASVSADSPTAEIIREGQFGIVVPPENADELAKAICSLADDATRMRRMGEAARACFLSMFDRQTQVARLERLLDDEQASRS